MRPFVDPATGKLRAPEPGPDEGAAPQARERTGLRVSLAGAACGFIALAGSFASSRSNALVHRIDLVVAALDLGVIVFTLWALRRLGAASSRKA